MKVFAAGAELFHADGQTNMMKLIVTLQMCIKELSST